MLLKEFKAKWLACFAENVDAKKIKKYVIACGDYIWHVFSFELLPHKSYLKGDAARKAYNALPQREKETALYIEPFGKGKTFSLPCQNAVAEKLESYTEIYAVGADFSWTYIKTHECDSCGPYFYRKKQ